MTTATGPSLDAPVLRPEGVWQKALDPDELPPRFSNAPASYPTEVRDDGMYVALLPDEVRVRTVSDVIVETMVDFAAFAQLCGGAGYRVTAADELTDALTAALAHVGPALVEIVADPLLV